MPAALTNCAPNSGDTASMLTSVALVLMLTIAGLGLFYGGMVRKKNIGDTVMTSFAVALRRHRVYAIVSYSLAFTGGAPFIGGLRRAFLQGIVCLSCYTKRFAGERAFTYDQTVLGRFHRSYSALMAHWRAILPASHFLEVDYEKVVDNLEGEARRMLAFLGFPWDERLQEFHETERPVRTASVNQVREPIYRASVGRWKKHAAQLKPLLAALNAKAA